MPPLFQVYGLTIDQLSSLLKQASSLNLDRLHIENSLLGGWSNLNLLVRNGSDKYTLKFLTLMIFSDTTLYDRNASIYNALNQYGLAPRVLETGILDGPAPIPYMLVEFIDGTVYSDPTLIPDDRMRDLKVAHDKLSSLEIPGVPSYDSALHYIDHMIESMKVLVSKFDLGAAQKFALRLLDLVPDVNNIIADCPWSHKLMHGELSESNVVFTDQGAVFLDVPSVAIGEPLYDVAYLSVQHAQKVIHPPPILCGGRPTEELDSLRCLALFHVISWSIRYLHFCDIGFVEPNLSTIPIRTALVSYIENKLTYLEDLIGR